MSFQRRQKEIEARRLATRLYLGKIWHRPTFEGPCGPTIIGAGGLNCRVRDGNGWDPAAMGARNFDPRGDGEPELEPIASGNLQSCTEKNFQCHESVCVV